MLRFMRWFVVALLCAAPVWADSQSFTALNTDGTIYGTSGVYATARSTATAAATGDLNLTAGQDSYNGGTVFDVYRTYVEFDTSTIPTGATITSVTLTGTVGTLPSLTSSSAFNEQIRDYVWTTPLGGATLGIDFTGCINQPLDTGASAGILCAATACNIPGTQATATLATSSVTGGPGSRAKFCITSSRDTPSTPPNVGGEYIQWGSQESGNPFVLSVSWSSAGANATATAAAAQTSAVATQTANAVASQTAAAQTTPTRVATNTPLPGGVPTYTSVPNCGQPVTPGP